MAMPKWMRDQCIIDMGLNLADRDRFDEAITHFDRAIENEPENALFYFFRGRVNRDAGLAARNRINDRRNSCIAYENTSQSDAYFRASTKDYDKAEELGASQENVR